MWHEAELALPVWAYAMSHRAYLIALIVEGVLVLGAVLVGNYCCCRKRTLARRFTVLVLIFSGTLVAVAVLNFALNVVAWIDYGHKHYGQGAPFW